MASKLTRSNGAGRLFALPGAGLFAGFIILPFFLAFAFSLTNQRLASPNPTDYVGTKNDTDLPGLAIFTLAPERDDAGQAVAEDGEIQYPRLRTFTRNNPDDPHLQGKREWFSWQSGENRTVVLAADVVFMKALVNTFLFVIVVAPVQASLALGLALLITQKLRGISVFRAVYFMPVVVSIVVVSILWKFIYSPGDGLLNNVLSTLSFGLFQPRDWLGDTSTALGSIMAMSIRQGVGFHMVIWLSGLQTISPTLYEAAEIEGASKWQSFRYVTWPGLRNTAVLILIVITMQAFALYAQIAVMTQGGPLMAVQAEEIRPVMVGLGYFTDQLNVPWGEGMAYLTIITVPVLAFYLSLQRVFIASVASTGVKG